MDWKRLVQFALLGSGDLEEYASCWRLLRRPTTLDDELNSPKFPSASLPSKIGVNREVG